MNRLAQVSTLSALALALAIPSAHAENFKKLLGDAPVGDVTWKEGDALEAPFLTWGGDIATFYANGGAETADGSIFKGLGLNVKCVNGDDFIGQVKRYLKGETPLLRGTVRMIGLAAEALSANEKTKPVMFVQLTWSAGDHMVARKGVATLNDLKGKTIALQQGGPHVGMLDDILHAARLTWADINVVWCKDLTGTPDCAAEKFRTDPKIDAALCISPDMVGLCGGLTSKGSGADKTVKDSRVLVSTAQMSRSIADVYCVRKDFYDANKAVVQKFAAGYLKASEVMASGRVEFDKGKMGDEYKKGLTLGQTMFGKEVLPTIEVDAHGLVSDCSFVGLPGNVSFFTEAGNLAGFDKKVEAALNLATTQGYAESKGAVLKADFDYNSLKTEAKIVAEAKVTKAERFVDIDVDDLFPEDKKKVLDKVIVNFTITFGADQSSFPVEKYGADFQRAVEAATTFGNAAIAIGGHADPTLMLLQMVKAGVKKGILKREGSAGNYKYFLEGKEIDLANPAQTLEAIRSGKFAGSSETDPNETLKQLLKLSQDRAEAVRKAIIDYAQSKGIRLDPSQLKAVGVGAREPVVAKPTSEDEAAKNRRVEFRVVPVSAESVKKSDFDF